MMTTLALLLGVLLDRLLGEVPRWHPLVGFGRCATWLEARMNPQRFSGLPEKPDCVRLSRRGCDVLSGTVSWLILVAPPALLAYWLKSRLPVACGVVLDALALYFALGARALAEHAQAVAEPLSAGRLEAARHRVSYLVSRETASMDEEAAARATVESVLENGNDAIFGALFWCALLGAPGVIAFRLANTLDAMWGYRNARFNAFGWAAARFDDVLNFIPARLTAASYALLGQTRRALRCWRTQASGWSSPNAGPVMAAGAGALGIELGGAAVYDGSVEPRPPLGEGPRACATDIPRAMALIAKSVILWLAMIGALNVLASLS